MDVLGDKANDDVKKFIVTLIENRRLTLLPQIAEQFEALKARAEGVLDAVVESAYTLDDAQQADLIATLTKKYGKTVRIEVRVVPELIGGVRVLVGDDVIDASVSGKLQAMAASLKN